MTKHTPGPWSIDKEERWVIHEPEGKSGTLVVPEIYLDDDEAIANARLIAAAPELLEALESFPGFLCGTESGDAWIDQMRAAIAKARGEA